MPVTDVVIFHNPDCGTSRNVVRIVEAAGYTPVIVEYLKTGWTKPQLPHPQPCADVRIPQS